MATNQEGSGSKRRVSFLMPYIDFCFMLIIIFVSMLSIAYFEPLGRTDVQTKQANQLDNLEGKWEKKPVGLQVEKLGVGEQKPDRNVVPLVSSASRQSGSGIKPMFRVQSQRFETQSGVNSPSKTVPAIRIGPKSGQANKKGAAPASAPIPPSVNSKQPPTPVKPAVETNPNGFVPSATSTISNGDHFYIDLRRKPDSR